MPISHDTINRRLKALKLKPIKIWKQSSKEIIHSENGFVVIDDTVLDKRHSKKIQIARKLWDNAEKKIIMGIGLVTMVYVNPDLGMYWLLSYRVYDPSTDGKTKIQHALDLIDWICEKKLQFKAFMFDSWYTTKSIIQKIEEKGKLFYGFASTSRVIFDAGGHKHKLKTYEWTEEETEQGKLISFRQLREIKLKLFRKVASNGKADHIVTNDVFLSSLEEVKQIISWRFKIEEFHREIKQLTGIERCQCRLARIQRNHICCAIMAWGSMKRQAYSVNQTVYQLWTQQFSTFLKSQLKNPSLKFAF